MTQVVGLRTGGGSGRISGPQITLDLIERYNKIQEPYVMERVLTTGLEMGVFGSWILTKSPVTWMSVGGPPRETRMCVSENDLIFFE